MTEFFIGSGAYESDVAVVEEFFNFLSLLGGERRFDAVGMGGAEFDALDAGGLAVFDEGGQVPVAAPEVGDQAEFYFGTRGVINLILPIDN